MYFSAPQCHFYSCGLGRREKEKEEETKLGLERGVRRKGGGGGGCAPPPLKQSSREGPSLDSPKGLCCPLQSKSFTRRKEEETLFLRKGKKDTTSHSIPAGGGRKGRGKNGLSPKQEVQNSSSKCEMPSNQVGEFLPSRKLTRARMSIPPPPF